MSSSVTAVDSEPVNERNWYEKMKAAEKAHPDGVEWRKQFTRQELEIIDRAMEPEIRWAIKAVVHDLPGPRRFDAIVD
jgi:hypothetical protein